MSKKQNDFIWTTKYETLTDDEKSAVNIIRINKETPRTEIKKEISIGRLKLKFEWRAKSNLWGRFGGGWNIMFGFQFCTLRHVIIRLFICSISWQLQRKEIKQL